MQNVLDFVSFVPWTFIVMILNLFILFLLLKKFLFKPVNSILKQRQEEVDSIYSNAEEEKKLATANKEEYQLKLQNAFFEAEEIINTSHLTAQIEEKQIIDAAKQKASSMLKKAEDGALQIHKKAMKDLQGDISGMAIDIAKKVTEKEINQADHQKLIEDFIQKMKENVYE